MLKLSTVISYFLVTLVLIAVWHPAEGAEKKCSVEGRAVKAAGGQPLKGASIQLISAINGKAFYAVRTDAEGKFIIRGINPGRYALIAKRVGYEPQTHQSGGTLLFESGEQVKDVLFRLLANPTVIGRVLDENDNPMAGLEVQALIKATRRPQRSESQTELAPAKIVTTNCAGEYRLSGLPAGEYFLSAIDNGKRSLSKRTNTAFGLSCALKDSPPAYPPTYYPSTTDRNQAVAVPLSAGQELRLDFALRRGKTFSLSGRVVFRNLKPVSNATVSVEPRGADRVFTPLRYSGKTDAAGRFVLANISPGAYVLVASKQQGENTYSAQQPIHLGNENISNVGLTLGLGRIVSGRLVAQDGVLDLKTHTVMVWLHATDGDDIGFGAAEVEPDGSFRIMPELLEDKYRIEVSGLPDSFYLKAARAGVQDILTEGLTISNAVAIGPLELTVSSAAARLSGFLSRDGEPISEAQIEIVNGNATAYGFTSLSTTTDERGAFTVRGIPPGAYEIFVSDDQLNDLQPTNLNKGPRLIGEVELVEGDRKQLDLKMP